MQSRKEALVLDHDFADALAHLHFLDGQEQDIERTCKHLALQIERLASAGSTHKAEAFAIPALASIPLPTTPHEALPETDPHLLGLIRETQAALAQWKDDWKDAASAPPLRLMVRALLSPLHTLSLVVSLVWLPRTNRQLKAHRDALRARHAQTALRLEGLRNELSEKKKCAGLTDNNASTVLLLVGHLQRLRVRKEAMSRELSQLETNNAARKEEIVHAFLSHESHAPATKESPHGRQWH